MPAPAYRYTVYVVSVYDGDTVRLCFDLGLGMWNLGPKSRGESCRLHGINTPEMPTPEGKAARNHLRTLIEAYSLPVARGGPITGTHCLIAETHKDRQGKYGRWLVRLFGVDPTNGESVDLNTRMVTDGYAVEYMVDR